MTFVLACAALLSANLQGQNLAKPVTFASPAAPAKRIVAQLAQQAGLKLDVSAQVAPDVLFVQVDQVPAKDLLDRIAQTVNGEWSTEADGTLRLIRSPGAANREAAAERQEQLAGLQKQLKKYIDALTKKPAPKAPQKGDDEEGFDPAEYLANSAKESKLILTLLQRINLSDLIFTEADGRVVFSSNPTRMQRLLPGDLDGVVAEMVKEHNDNIAARKNEPDEEPPDEETKQWMEMMKQFGLDRDPKPLEGRPSKLLLIAEQQELLGGLNLTLRLYDHKGKAAIEKSMGLGMQSLMEDFVVRSKPQGAPKTDDPPIEFGPVTKELNSLFKSLGQPMARGKMSPEVEAKLLRPDEYDPLSFGPSDSLASVAKHRKLSVVALIPDDFQSFVDLFAEKGGTVGTFMSELESSDEVKLVKPEGWLLVMPKHPAQGRRNRADRVALARLIGAARSKGLASLDDIAAYALTSPSPYEGTAAMPYLMLFAPNAMQQGLMGIADWNALRLYGTLGPAQRQALASQNRLAIGTMAPNQQTLLTRMLFGSRSDLKIQDPNAKPKDEIGFFEMMRGMVSMGAGGGDYRQEPTEIMPNGLPMQGYLAGEFVKEPVGRSEGNDPIMMFGALGSDELAILRYFKEDPKMAAMSGMIPTIDRMRLGERTNIELKVFVTPEVALERRLQDNQIDPNGPVVSMDNLPAHFRARIDKRLEAFKKSPFPGLAGLGGGGPVKPPQE